MSLADICWCDDYDAPVIQSVATYRASKRYRCEECSGFIEAGENYERTKHLYEGHWATFRTCERCVGIRRWVQTCIPCFCWCIGNMIEGARAIVEEAQSIAPDEAAGLRFGLARRIYVRDRFNRERREAVGGVDG